jgi:hypothetical protein
MTLQDISAIFAHVNLVSLAKSIIQSHIGVELLPENALSATALEREETARETYS